MRTRIAIFNHVNANGRVYVANSKEEVEKLFHRPEYFITDPVGTYEQTENLSFGEFQKRFCEVDIGRINGSLGNIEVIETGDIGVNDLPIYEVYSELKIFDTPKSKMFDECFRENVVSIGIRSIGTGWENNHFIINNVICFDVIIK